MSTRTHATDYEPVGSAKEVWYSQQPEILLSGPAGTGKSRAILEKLFYMAEVRYPGMRALIVRKTRESLTQTALFTWEQFVLPQRHPVKQGPQRSHRQTYQFPNGSEIVVGGMDKPQKIMSSEYDFIYPQEAIELNEEDWESLTTRLRNGRVPYQQIVADTNPGSPSHWLKKRCDAGRCKLINTRHEDNPVLHDGKDWTPFGRTYLVTLDNLTGARKQRLRYGKWVQAEGAVYEGWDATVHVVDRYTPPKSWEWYLAVDFGFTNPFVCQLWAVDPDGRMVLVREVYRTKTLVPAHCEAIKAMLKWAGNPTIARVVCDHDAEGRKELTEGLGLGTRAADKAVDAGIQIAAERMKIQEDGKPRLTIMRDAVWEPDPFLTESSKPWSTEQEIDGYVWSDKYIKEQPVKENDHGMDAMRYLCKHLAHGTFAYASTTLRR